MKHKAIFLDRDGTVIEDRGYICRFSQVAVFPFAAPALRLMKEQGFKVIVVTNQSAVARGICSEAEVQELHAQLKQYLLDREAPIQGFYYCPFHQEGVVEEYKKKHPWRKPAPGMILQAARDHDLDLSRSYMMGDSAPDILAGHRAGCKTVLVHTGKPPVETRQELARLNMSPGLDSSNILTAMQTIAALSKP